MTVLGPSIALDLSWAILSVSKPTLQLARPALGTLYRERPELARAVQEFWDDGVGCHGEIEVLAIWGDALQVADIDTLLARLRAAIDTVPLDLGLESEDPEQRAVILARLAELRRSPPRRQRWEALLRDVWSGLDQGWRTSSVPVVERAAAEARSQLDRGTHWVSLVGTKCEVFKMHQTEILERHAAGQPVVLVPCAFFGRALYLEMPSCIVLGFGTSGADGVSRARTAEVARRLRVLADPTRLAILDHLADGASSVGEIAQSFSLAQPTVSTHVKHLREAGLVTSDRRGTRVEVSVNQDAVRAVADELGSLLAR